MLSFFVFAAIFSLENRFTLDPRQLLYRTIQLYLYRRYFHHLR